MIVEIDDDDLSGFNPQAVEHLQSVSSDYISEVIRESNRIEAARNSSSNTPEITSSMVTDADLVLRRNLVKSPKSIGRIGVRVAAAVLSLIAGVMYDSVKLQDNVYMLIFVVTVAASIVAVTISAIQE